MGGKVPSIIDQFGRLIEIQKLDSVTSQTRFSPLLKLYNKSFAQLGPVGNHVIVAHVVHVLDEGDKLLIVVGEDVVVPYV